MQKDEHKCRLLRFYAFKATEGMDAYPSPQFSISNIFDATLGVYSSQAIKGPNLVQAMMVPHQLCDTI